MRGLSILSLVLFLFVAPGALDAPALAQPETHRAAAEKLVQEGLSLARTKKFEEAVKKFEEAFKLYPHPEIQHNLARAHEELGQLKRAYDYFSAALQQDYTFAADGRQRLSRIETELRKTHARLTVRSTPSQVKVLVTFRDGDEETHTSTPFATWAPAGSTRLVGSNPNFKTTELTVDLTAGEEREVALVLAPIPRQGFLQISVNVAGATISLAGTPIGKSPLSGLVHDAGIFDLEVRKLGYKPHRESVTVTVDQVAAVNVVLALDETAPVDTPSSLAPLGWTLIATGVAAGGAAAYLQFGQALPLERDANALDPDPINDAEYDRLIGKAKDFQTAALVSAIVGGVLATGGVIILATDSPSPAAESARGPLFIPTLSWSPGNAFVGGQLRF